MLTFENVLEIFQEYLLRDPEEEVLPCKRGYVRLTWNKDSRYCVDGILCQAAAIGRPTGLTRKAITNRITPFCGE